MFVCRRKNGGESTVVCNLVALTTPQSNRWWMDSCRWLTENIVLNDVGIMNGRKSLIVRLIGCIADCIRARDISELFERFTRGCWRVSKTRCAGPEPRWANQNASAKNFVTLPCFKLGNQCRATMLTPARWV